MNNVDKLNIRSNDNGVILPVKVVPGSSRDKIAGVLGDALKVNTSTAPEKGKANKAIIKFLAKSLGIPKTDIILIAGQTNPHKEFQISNLSETRLRDILAKVYKLSQK